MILTKFAIIGVIAALFSNPYEDEQPSDNCENGYQIAPEIKVITPIDFEEGQG